MLRIIPRNNRKLIHYNFSHQHVLTNCKCRPKVSYSLKEISVEHQLLSYGLGLLDPTKDKDIDLRYYGEERYE